MKVIIFGSSGLVGNLLLSECLSNTAISEVRIFVRKKTSNTHPKLKQIETTFSTLDTCKNDIAGDVVFNCLGTTLKAAGSQKAQYEIDCEYPVKVAQIATHNGIKTMVSISSVGASASGNFYLKTKADMESGIGKAIGANSYFLRPSFLVGNRKDFRIGERIGIALFTVVNYLLIGSLRKYRSIQAARVAKAMMQIALQKPTQTIFYFDDIINLSAATK